MAFHNAQLSKSVVYYFSNPSVYGGTGEIIMGLPEQYAAPPGFEKVVCTSTAAAEKWSARMRKWEETKEEIAQMYQRHQEEKQVEAIRSDMRSKIANAKDSLNREFMIQALANFDKRYADRFATERTSFLHAEGYSADDKSVQTPKVRLPKKLAHGGVFE
jgi:transketolase